MNRKAFWIVIALALAVSIPALARQAAPEQITQGPTMEGVGDTYGLIERFNKISDRFAEDVGEDEMTKLLEEQSKLQDAIDTAGGWELERKLEIAADSLSGAAPV